MIMKKMIALMTAAVLAVASLAGCGGSSADETTEAVTTEAAGDSTEAEADDTAAADDTTAASEESDMAYVQDKGTLVVGVTNFEPMDYLDESGEWIGLTRIWRRHSARALA